MSWSKLERILGLVCLLFWTSCQYQKQSSILILAFENMNSEELNCSDERSNSDSGLALLCKESIRFTHAMTTSLQPVAAMASLLSAELPQVHQLRRSQNRINSDIQLVQDLAIKNGLRTSFFSGSPSILKKSGLSRSFEIFDDSIASSESLFRWSFLDQLKQISQWIFEENSPFFSVIYISNVEPTSFNEDDDSELHSFFQKLKEKKLWDNTNIILLGLKGQTKFSRLHDTRMSNLHSENLNIALLHKPPREKGDEGINWKNDNLINLADVGHSLFCLLGQCEIPIQKNADHSKDKYLNYFQTVKIDEPTLSTRIVVIEAPNPFAKNEFNFALRTKSLLYIHAAKASLFNTLADRQETTDIPFSKANQMSQFTDLIFLLQNFDPKGKLKPWVKYSEIDLVKSNQKFWTAAPNQSEILKTVKDPRNPLLGLYELSSLKGDNKKTRQSILRASQNLALENTWGLFENSKSWSQSIKSTKTTDK